MRLIDAKLMENHIMDSKVFTQYFKEIVQALIWGEDTVDAVPVVRCKDCEHYTLGPFGMGCMAHFNHKTDIFTHNADDYCSSGKRKEENI